jgi:hypothetical protein
VAPRKNQTLLKKVIEKHIMTMCIEKDTKRGRKMVALQRKRGIIGKHSTAQHSTAQHSTAQHSTAQ